MDRVSYAYRMSASSAGIQSNKKTSDPNQVYDFISMKNLEDLRGWFLFSPKLINTTMAIIMVPWKMWWQVLILCVNVFTYLVHLLLAFYFKPGEMLLLSVLVLLLELPFLVDVLLQLLHMFWPLLRYRIRVYRRSLLLLFCDVISLFPFQLIFQFILYNETWVMVGRVLVICRIYRLFIFYYMVNESMHTSRKVLYILEHLVTFILLLHAGTCLTYAAHRSDPSSKQIPSLYPEHIVNEMSHFSSYGFCFYYSACRLCNAIFGDGFPMKNREKWITSFLMLFGYVFLRYEFIGALSWELVITNNRRAIFVDRYHHMLRYLKFHGAPPWLTRQAENFKQQLWLMKDGILSTEFMDKIPLPLQMEFIFDINVQHLHYTLVFRDNDEALLRHISLLMKHEIYLEGQIIWSQGVVKQGLLCVKQGVIEMLSVEDDESPMISFHKGTVLGELSLFYSIPAKVTVRAATYVELQVLHRTDFMKIMLEHHDMLKNSRNIIMQRIFDTRTRQEEIQDYDRMDARLIKAQYRPMKVLKNHLKGVKDEDPTLVDDSHMYYKDKHNIMRPKFTDEYLELYEITYNVTTIQKPKICLRATFPWILEPDTDLRDFFDILHFILVVYVCLITPFKLVRNNIVKLQWLKVLDTVVYTGLLLNLYLQCTTAIINRNMKKVTVKGILDEKMSTFGFYLDLVSVFPMNIFSFNLDPTEISWVEQVLFLAPTLQIWHIWDYMEKWEKNFHSNERMVCICKFLLMFMILSYWSGCVLYLCACPQMLCKPNSWMTKLIYWETRVLITNVAKHESRYFTALSFGVAVFTGSGRSDISPGQSDQFVVLVLFLIGAYLICFYNAKICSLYLLSTQRKSHFKEAMRQLFYFLSVNHVSGKIKSRVRKFFVVQWYYNNAVSTEEIFKNMSTKIQQEVLAIEMVETLTCCPLFLNCSRDFLQTVASNTRAIILPDNEIVQHAGDIGRDMYILQKGHCDMVNQQGSVVYSIGPGQSIGVVEMLFGLPKVYTVLTSTNCILLYLEYSALVQSWSPFPDISDPITKVLEEPELKSKAQKFEETKQQTGRMNVKTSKIAQEIKESFVLLLGYKEKKQFVDEFEKLGVLKYIRWFFVPACITPHGVFLKFWCALRFILAFYYIITVPYNIATKQHENKGQYDWPDIFLYIDLIVMSYVAYYNEKSLLVTHPLLTVSRYLKTSFVLDLISVAPFEQFLLLINKNTDFDLCRVNRVLLVSRVIGTFSHWEDNIMRVSQVVVLLKFLPLGLTIVNFATALVFMDNCVAYLPLDSYFVHANCSKAVLPFKITTADIKFAFIEYINTFYWLFEVFLGCGCESVISSKPMEVTIMMGLQVLSVMYFAFMCGHIACTSSATAHALLDYTEKRRDLANFLYQMNVEPMLTVKTLKYFEYVWKRTHGSNPQQICRCLNSALMEDTLVFMYEQALREVPLFGKVDRSFIRVITQHLNEMYVLKGETVIQCKDVQPYIFIIYRGKVDVFNSFNEMITCMGPGGMFGNFSGNAIACSEVTIYASRSLDLLVIPSHTFFNLVKYYPKIKAPLDMAFEVSKDYILPISMHSNIEDSSSDSSTYDTASMESTIESKSASSRLDVAFFSVGQLSITSSQSSLAYSHHSYSSLTISNSYFHFTNILFPGSALQLAYGYLMCCIVTGNYVVVLYEIVTLNDCLITFWIQFIFDVSIYVKLLTEMHTGFLNKHGEVVLDAARCRRRYFRRKALLWSNIVANMPFEVLGFCFRTPLTYIHYFRANKLLRLKFLFEFYKKTSSELTNNITILQLAMTIFVVIIIIHSLSCVWLLTMSGTAPFISIRNRKMLFLDVENPQQRWDFTTSFYVIVSKITATGSDELYYTSTYPMLLSIIALVCGKMLSASVVATSIQVANSTKYALTTFERKIDELFALLKNQGLSGYQQEKFWQYVKQLWVSERGRQLPELLQQTPYVRKCDLMSAMFGHHLRNSYLFSGIGEPFLRQLTVVLNYTVYFPGNYIVMAGDSEAQMHFIEDGTVAVVSVRPDLTETTHEMLHAGDVFGVLQGLSRGIQNCFTYKAHTKVSILTLCLDSWINILQFFPEAQKLLAERTEHVFTQI